jgi:hypothetical protein
MVPGSPPITTKNALIILLDSCCTVAMSYATKKLIFMQIHTCHLMLESQHLQTQTISGTGTQPSKD